MVLKIHGSLDSTCTQRVLTVLEEKQVAYELVAIDFAKQEHKTAEHVKLQPWGKVPVLEDDDGFLLFESRAIARYIAMKFRGQGTDLIPGSQDLKSWALLEQAISVESFNFDPAVSALAFEKRYKAWQGLGPADEQLVAIHIRQLEATLAIYEKTLAKTKYLLGDDVSLADLFHLPFAVLNWELGLEDVYAKYPAVHSWLKGLQQRQSWKKIHA